MSPERSLSGDLARVIGVMALSAKQRLDLTLSTCAHTCLSLRQLRLTHVHVLSAGVQVDK